jgi:DNA-binding HxlR family transcriptional regulator
MVESIVGCKWSMHVLAGIRSGVHRPGALERACKGISTKVLNERLRKLTRFGIVDRRVFADVPPRVEYRFTAFGREFITLVDAVDELQRRLDGVPKANRAR